MEWIDISNRFRKLSEKTGMNKVASYDLSVQFDGVANGISVHLFTYDVADWNRHTNLGPFSTDEEAKAATIRKIEEAEIAVDKDILKNGPY